MSLWFIFLIPRVALIVPFFWEIWKEIIQNEVRLGEGPTIKVTLLIPIAMFCAENAAVPYGFLPMLQCLCDFVYFFPKYFRYFLKTIAKFKLKSFWWKVLNSEWKRGQKIVLRSYSLLLSNYLGWNEDDKSLTSSKYRRWYVYFIFQKSNQCAEVQLLVFFLTWIACFQFENLLTLIRY